MSVQLGGWAVHCRPSSGHHGARRQRQCLWGTLGEWTPSSALGAEGTCSWEALDWRITASFQAPSCPDDTGLGPSVAEEWTVDSVGTGLGSGPGWSVPDVGLGNVPQAFWASGVWSRPSPRLFLLQDSLALCVQVSLEMEVVPVSRNGHPPSLPPPVRLHRLGWKLGRVGRWGDGAGRARTGPFL